MAIQPASGVREERGFRVGARIEDAASGAGDNHSRAAVHRAVELHGERGRDRGEGGEFPSLGFAGNMTFIFPSVHSNAPVLFPSPFGKKTTGRGE